MATRAAVHRPSHWSPQRPATPERRGTAAERGYDRRWRRARLSFLRRNPLCVECMKANRTTAATVVDHVIPHRGDPKLFWDEKNWQPLCKPDHDRKTGSGQ